MTKAAGCQSGLPIVRIFEQKNRCGDGNGALTISIDTVTAPE
jgi:hypothetical protein